MTFQFSQEQQSSMYRAIGTLTKSGEHRIALGREAIQRLDVVYKAANEEMDAFERDAMIPALPALYSACKQFVQLVEDHPDDMKSFGLPVVCQRAKEAIAHADKLVADARGGAS